MVKSVSPLCTAGTHPRAVRYGKDRPGRGSPIYLAAHSDLVKLPFPPLHHQHLMQIGHILGTTYFVLVWLTFLLLASTCSSGSVSRKWCKILLKKVRLPYTAGLGPPFRCNWTPPSGKYSPRIAPADAMVIDFGVKIELWGCEIAFQS